MPESDRRLIELETRIAFQEDAINELSRAAARQRNDIDALRREIDALRRQLRDLAPPASGAAGDEPPPPHY